LLQFGYFDSDPVALVSQEAHRAGSGGLFFCGANIRKKVILLQVLQVLQVLRWLHEAPEAHRKLTGSNLKQTIAQLIFIKHLKHLKHLKQTFFFLMNNLCLERLDNY